MKNVNVFVGTAVAGLFAVSAYAGSHKKAEGKFDSSIASKEACEATKGNKWTKNKASKKDECWVTTASASTEGASCSGKDAHSCGSKEGTSTEATTK